MGKPKRLILAFVVVVVLLLAVATIAVRYALGGDAIKTAIEAQASRTLGQPVAIRAVTPRIFPRAALDLSGISIGSSREVTIEKVRLSTGLRALLGQRIEDADVLVETSQIDVRWAVALLGVLIDTTPPSTSSPTFVIESVRSIAFRDVTLLAGQHRLLVDLTAALTAGDRLALSELRATADGSSFTASGELASVSKRTGRFTLDAQTLDLDGLMAFMAAATPHGSNAAAGAATPAPPGAPASPLAIDVDIRARESRAIGIAMRDLTATARLRDDGVALEGMRIAVFGGHYAGSAALRGSQLEWKGTFENLDVPQLVAFAGSPGAMTGRLGGAVALTARGADPAQAIRVARGTAQVTITDGRVPRLELVRSVVLAFGKPTGDRPAGSGEAFSRVAATLAVDGPRLSTRNLEFQSRDVDMTGEGQMSLATQAIAFRTNLVLSRELSAQAGRDLYRLAREGDRVVLPATIGGTTTAPTVFIDVQAALQRALRNKAQDELKGLLDRFRGRIIR
jgi:uncharacterized protein involved in outer membrane biogenesis